MLAQMKLFNSYLSLTVSITSSFCSLSGILVKMLSQTDPNDRGLRVVSLSTHVPTEVWESTACGYLPADTAHPFVSTHSE